MKFWLQGILFMFFGLLFIQANAQPLPEINDSINFKIEKPAKKHIPSKATMYSAVLPGLGQIYNKKYFKVPIIYGGFIGLGIVIDYYSQKYVDYKQAYYDLNDNNPSTKSYETTYPFGDYTNVSNYETYSQTFIQKIEDHRRQRDLLIIATVGFYLLNVLDANVDAHFIDFDISEDLTFNFEPIFADPITNSPILGGHFVFTF